MDFVRLRLIRKLAEMIDGVDLSRKAVGDTVSLGLREAQLLLAEGWAVPIERGRREHNSPSRSVAQEKAVKVSRGSVRTGTGQNVKRRSK